MAIILIAMSASTMNNSEIIVSPSSVNVPTSSNDVPSASVDPTTVFDESHAQHLLDQTMMSATKDAKTWKRTSDFILLYIKGSKGDLRWSPEKVILTEGKAFDEGGVLYFGLEDSTGESFYAGPVVCWYQEKPGDPIIYEPSFIATTGGDFTEWKETPYKYGVEAYADPPEEILKIFSDNNVQLIH
ncbi:MAG TPA: hypothetical protein DCS12_05575 [Clostridiales bacterium]|nr:hypothetical protein [Clostridiales bacterium]